MAGETFEGRFQILSVLGQGGVGVVYKAKHMHMDKTVAIKMLLPAVVSDAASFKRFEQEARTASNLNHPNIISVFDFGKSVDGSAYLVMEFLSGNSLDDLIKQNRRIDTDLFLQIFSQACDGLQHAHKHGVMHRDLKPSNIMLIEREDAQNVVKIVDFGLAKLTAADSEQNLTHSGSVMGTPLYMSPEQCQGAQLDHRTDIYSLGCVMYTALTGRVPIIGDNAMNTMFRHISEAPAPLSLMAPDVPLPAGLEQAVMKALQKDPNARQQSMNELRNEITEAILYRRAAPRPLTGNMPAVPNSKPNERQGEAHLKQSRTLQAASMRKTIIEEAPPTVPVKSGSAVAPVVVGLVIGGVAVALAFTFMHGSSAPQIGATTFQQPQPASPASSNTLATSAASTAEVGKPPAQLTPDNSVSHEKTQIASGSPSNSKKIAHVSPEIRTPGKSAEKQEGPHVTPAVAEIEKKTPHHSKSNDGKLKNEELDRASKFEAMGMNEVAAGEYNAARASFESCLQYQKMALSHNDPALFLTLARILFCINKSDVADGLMPNLKQALSIFDNRRPAVERAVNDSGKPWDVWRTFATACKKAADLSAGDVKDTYLVWSVDFYERAISVSPDKQKTKLVGELCDVLDARGDFRESANLRREFHLNDNRKPFANFMNRGGNRRPRARGLWQR